MGSPCCTCGENVRGDEESTKVVENPSWIVYNDEQAFSVLNTLQKAMRMVDVLMTVTSSADGRYQEIKFERRKGGC